MLERDVDPDVPDALLCRLVFTCSLFDVGVIDAEYLKGAGIADAEHLREVLSIKPRHLAKDYLYNKLFKSLGADFNGDLFSDDLLGAFTLMELMISIALVLLLVLGVNRPFTFTTQADYVGEEC